MKLKIYTLLAVLTLWVSACKNLDVPPVDVIKDQDVFTTEGGIQLYMARMYSLMPFEDFKYSPTRGLNFFWLISPVSNTTGEALGRDLTSSVTEQRARWDMQNTTDSYWFGAYRLIREANYFMETLPKYAANFNDTQMKNWLGEAHFIRAFTYYAMVKRYGGVPIIDKVLNYPDQSTEELKVPRAAEEEVWDFIATDFDYAIANMSETSPRGRANKYAAAAFKSRAMVHAGSIAKYNQVSLVDGGKRLCGIPAAKAVTYYKAAYDAAKMLDGKYSLYKKAWAAGDKAAQYKNYVDLFFDATSPENILVKDYHYPEAAHGWDAYMIPRQLAGPNGYSSAASPTLNFVEMFDGLPKNADGTIKTLDNNGKYILYNNTMDLFTDAEPRLRATVVLPGDIMKGESIEIYRGIYTASAAGGIDRLLPEGSTSTYPSTNIVSSANASQTPYTLPDGSKKNPAGKSGIFTNDATCSITGFFLRKYINEARPTSQVLENREDQTFIEMRYAEVLLNLAEAAFELNALGQGGTYQQDAFNAINMVRERAGATLLASPGALTVNEVRKERRKELAFENKTWWDLKRWRIIDKEQNGTLYRSLMPFYSADAKKYFFDARLDEKGWRYTFDPRWYYQQIPNDEISKSTNLVQNPGY
jgi:hypothetical protein